MAKFRTNHKKQNAGSDTIVKVGIFGALMAGLFYVFNLFSGGEVVTEEDASLPQTNYRNRVEEPRNFDYLPTSTTGQVIHHEYYSLSYSEEHEQAEWVAYVLRRDSLNKPWQQRRDRFSADPMIRTGSATDSDYRNSGYDRGHLVPAADMAFNPTAMKETFYLSNVSPQSRNFNQGVWRELEELTRDWAKKYQELYVVSGPVLTEPPKGAIGTNEVSIPAAYYKVLLDISDPELKGIAFLLPNEVSYDPLFKYATSIDEIEAATNLDFFSDLLDESLESQLESSYNLDLWYFSKSKFQKRVEDWNNVKN